MKRTVSHPYVINSISELHRLLQLPKPAHPLVSVINFADVKCIDDEKMRSIVYNFYSVCTKKGYKGKVKYGQNYYDFDDGIMTFYSPGQVLTTEPAEPGDSVMTGWWLVVHPDFIRNYTLATKIKNYGFFSYAVNESLHLSDGEEVMVNSIMENIAHEHRSVIDGYSQDVIVSQIELMLNYANRFYNRQFITRKNASNDLLVKMETLLDAYFEQGTMRQGLPTVQYLSSQLNISANYLSDMLRSLTGQSAQQHIQNKVIEKAKEILTTTSLSVGEVAYQLGFEYPQSFSKFFKSKTNISPLDFRQSFN
ncbi:MAG: helix-turn-helix transcriptional regulator [Flavipsychrobacter sp.]|nr:helix-turn-helix transcriptional regulator [Flavipsychrobacter sp.]